MRMMSVVLATMNLVCWFLDLKDTTGKIADLSIIQTVCISSSKGLSSSKHDQNETVHPGEEEQ
jgi:hypothetical protein